MQLRRSAIFAVLMIAGLVCAYAADITGKWTTSFDSQVGKQEYVFEFKVDGDKLTGTAISKIEGAEAKTPITEGKVSGDAVTFVENLNYQGMELKIAYTGKIVSADEIRFSRMVGEQEGEKFVAKRAK